MDLSKIQGLLGSPQALDIGLGLLSQSGWAPKGQAPTFGQAVAGATQFAGQRQNDRMMLEARRMQLERAKKQQAAQDRLANIVGTGLISPQQIQNNQAASMGISNMPMGLLNPETQNALGEASQFWGGVQENRNAMIPGLLAEAAPELAIESMLAPNTSPQTSSKFADYIALGGDPRDMESYQDFSGNSSQEIRDMLDALNLKNMVTEADLGAEERTRLDRQRAIGRRSIVDNAAKIVDDLEAISGTAAETGFFGQGAKDLSAAIAGLQNAAGVTDSRARELALITGRLGKNFSTLNSKAIPDAFMGSDRRLSFYSEGQPGLDQLPAVNLEILKTALRDTIDQEFIYNGSVDSEEAKKAARLIERIDGILSGGSQERSVPDLPPGFEKD